MSHKKYNKEYYERMKKDPEALEARRKKARERQKRKRHLDKIQKNKAFLESNGFTVTL